MRINVRLLETTRGRTLWAERFVGDAGSVFQIQDEVVERIAAALQVRLTQSMLPLRRSGATKSVAAYDEFLRGQERYGRRTLGTIVLPNSTSSVPSLWTQALHVPTPVWRSLGHGWRLTVGPPMRIRS